MLLFFFFYAVNGTPSNSFSFHWGRLWGGCTQKGCADLGHICNMPGLHTQPDKGQLKKGKEKKEEKSLSVLAVSRAVWTVNTLSVLFSDERSLYKGTFTAAETLCPNGTHLCLVPQLEHIRGYGPSPGNMNVATCARTSQGSASTGKAMQGCRGRIPSPEGVTGPLFSLLYPWRSRSCPTIILHLMET